MKRSLHLPIFACALALALPACKDGGTTGPSQQANRAPTASFTMDDLSPLIGATLVTFTGSGSDPDGDSLTYSWNMGDGNTKTGQTTTHTYQTAGAFSVVLTVADNRGSSTTASNAITARRLSGNWFSQARAWHFELVHSGSNITGRLLGFRDVGFTNPPPVIGRVRPPRAVEFDVEGGLGFTGNSDAAANEMTGTLSEGSRRYGEILVRE